MLSKLTGIFKQGWLASLIGLVMVAFIIYFLGNTIGWRGIYPLAEMLHRYIAIAALFVAWGVWQLWKVVRAKRKNKQMVDSLMASSEPQLSQEGVETEEQVAELKERLQDALHSLEKIRHQDGKSGDAYLYQLPWYIIIGPPGAGKTTLLANSNLHFPLSDKYGREAMRGVGGTRNCDWWFTDDAILLDTAGRFVIHGDQKQVNAGSWLGFLQLLKQHRSQQPINGVLIAVSLVDFMQQDEASRAQQAKEIRQRIQELFEQLGIRFPVYMLFTKADLVAGFNDFFDDLDKAGREQVWGMTFPYVDDPNHAAHEQFAQEFELLAERLNRQLLAKLDKERATERRRAMYLFPQQFSSLKDGIQQFLQQVYQPSKFDKTPMLRGVYFTSATQEGAPIDRVMAALACNFGVAPQQLKRFSTQGKSFFINKLLSKVVFNEAGLAGSNLQLVRRKQWLQSFALVGAVVLSLVGSLVWGSSYLKNRAMMDTYQADVAQADKLVASLPADADTATHFQALDSVRQLTWSYADNTVEIPWTARFGLSRSQSLREVMDEKYESLLKERMTPYAKSLLEQKIQRGIDDPQQVESLFNALKAYLFLGGRAPADIKVSGVNQIDWNNNGVSGDEMDWHMSQHMKVLLEKGAGGELDTDLLVSARAALEGAELDKLAYYQFKAEGLEADHEFDFLVRDKEGLNNINASFRKKSNKPWAENVAGFFTKAGYEHVFLPNYQTAAQRLAKESWVLGKGIERLGNPAQIAKTFEAEYQRDYIAAWQGFLADLQPNPVTSVQDAKLVLSGLTSSGGNVLLRLMEEVSQETDFDPPKDEEGQSSAPALPPLQQVDRQFQDVQDWTDAARFQSIGSLLDDAYQTLNQEGVFETDHKALTDALGKLSGEALKLPVEVRGMVQETVDAVKTEALGVIKGNLLTAFKQTLQQGVGGFCQTSLRGKYPFASNKKVGTNLADFSEFFQKNGQVDQFLQQHETSTMIDPQILKKVKRQLTAAQPVRKAFFPQGHLKFNYKVEWVSNYANEWDSVNLSTGIQSKDFKNVGQVQTFSWPDGSSVVVNGVRAIPLDVMGSNEGMPLDNTLPPAEPELAWAREGDEWLLFRLLVNRRLDVPLVGVFKVTGVSTPDPFKVVNNELRNFRCPTL